MKKYSFILLIPANCEQEAKAKLDLLLQLGSFFKDFDVCELAGSFLNYKVHHYLGKLQVKNSDDPGTISSDDHRTDVSI